MNIVSPMGCAMLLMVLDIGRASSILHDGLNDADLKANDKEERSIELTPRLTLLKDLVQDVTNLGDIEVLGVYNYGCWCGPRGQGKVVDNFDYCCKVHDFCENELQDNDKCGTNKDNMNRNFKYDADTLTCSPVSEYRSRDVEANTCRHAVCICDMEMVRCMKHYKDAFSSNNVGWVTTQHKSCAVTGGVSCKTKADVIVLIQDSQGISTATVENIKTVVRRLLTLLGAESTDFKFALATYAKSRRMSCFGSATETISYMDREYNHGQRGTRNLLKRALSRMVLKQFQNRRDDRKGDDTSKILVIFSDGRAEHGRGSSGKIMDTFRLEKAAKLLRVDNTINIVGALVPNSDSTQRIQELKGIVTEPDDAIDEDFTSRNLNNIADLLAARVKRFVSCPVTYTIEVFTEETFVNKEYNLKVRIEGQDDKETEDHSLIEPATEMQGDLFVIKAEFSDLDVGTVRRVHLSARRKVQGNNVWTLKKVTVQKEGQTVTAVFNEDIPAWPIGEWYSAGVQASNPPTEN